MINLLPALIPLGGALLTLLMPRRIGALILPLTAFAALILITGLPEGSLIEFSFLQYSLNPLHVDQLSRIFGIIFALITGITGVYGYATLAKGEMVAGLLYACGSLGATFAGDYLTFYLSWELMAIASFYLIIARDKEGSRRAAIRYFFVHLTGGVILLAGIIWTLNRTGSIALETIPQQSANAGAWLILIGIAINAAVVPLHAWLPDAYPRATIVGAVFLSALTTKTALYALARIFPGWEILIPFGVLMAVYGVVFAFMSDDIRSILAYHIVSQVGFMVCGVGIGTEMAINGAVAHAFCHILYKALLFMGTGAVLYATGKSRLTELGGLIRSLPFVFILYMVGAVSISGLPLFNGFISKSMVIYASEQVHFDWTTTFLYVASVGTFLSVGLKLPYYAWFHKKTAPAVQSLPAPMLVGMSIAALLCLILGIYPDLLYRALPYPVHYKPYTVSHILHTCWLLAATGLAFYWIVPKLKTKSEHLIDTDWFYRRPAALYQTLFVTTPGRIFNQVQVGFEKLVTALKAFIRNPPAYIEAPQFKGMDFDPDLQRRPLSWTVSAILICFLLIGLLISLGT